jgi:hypothetical protein
VLIGHNTNTPKQTAAATPNQTIKVEGVGGAGAAAAAKHAKTNANAKAFKAPKTPKLTKKVVKKVNAAAATVLGSGTKNLSQNPTQQVGQSCSGGAGCDTKHHKFTGNFFGGG